MSRSWQYHGFNSAANAILNEKVKIGTKVVVELDLESHPTKTYTQDLFKSIYTKTFRYEREVWYDEMNQFFTYTFPDGRVLEDYVQAQPWSSGPCTFMALRDAVTKEPVAETLWPQEDIDNA